MSETEAAQGAPQTEYQLSSGPQFNRPWLVAVWPGMGHVAISAGYYLLAKLGMHVLAEFAPSMLFDVDHVDVKDGLIRTSRLPRSRFFVWVDPHKKHDLVVFIGEAQPPTGKFAFCRQLVEYARSIGVERVFTFAAMATQMRPENDSRVFCAATDEQGLAELKKLNLQLLDEGPIGGLNGVLLGVAAEAGLRGACLLGEMPQVFAQLPFPKAAMSVLKVFTTIASIEIDFSELNQQARAMEQELTKILASVEQQMQGNAPAEEEEEEQAFPPPDQDELLGAEDKQRIENLFEQAHQDRSKAYELKRELDRLNVFKDYENRFLDLFKKPEG
jgi:uncharacterized protein